MAFGCRRPLLQSVLPVPRNTPPDENTPETIADYKLLPEIASKIVIPEFDNGPFVIGHNGLAEYSGTTSGNPLFRSS